ncbi:MAG: hypothetical protein JO133_08050 [Burkholderiaceae bacterium]|nr:hypothetical protein [Burkholderiaceae bacterium]
MPLVHRLSGTGFASSEDKNLRVRERPSAHTGPFRSLTAFDEPEHTQICVLCLTGAPTFDLSMRCCLDRYESLFGSVSEHRDMFASARRAALRGDFGPARRLVESYRRVFGPMAAVELRRVLWESVGGAQSRQHARPAG